MAISQPVLEPLREAERNLREALAASARVEKPHVPAIISEMIVSINTLIDMTNIIEEISDQMPKRY